MADRREQIMARLVEIMQGFMPDVVKVERNVLQISETARPAICVYDADEEAVDEMSDRPSGRPYRIDMSPEVYVLLGARKEDVGTLLNAWRAKIIKAVLTDSQLISIVGPNGRIGYDSCMTSLAPGRATEGNLGIGFSFRYLMIPSEL